MSIIMFDTNAYRGLAFQLKDKSFEDKFNTICRLNEKELEAGHTKELNFWVVCELLKHLEDQKDPAYSNCLMALEIALHHCTHNGLLNLSKPIEFEVADYYGIENSRIYYHALFMKVISLATQVIQNGRTEEFEKSIPAVGQYISDFQNMIIPGFIDAKTKLENDAELKLLKKVGFLDESAYKMIIRALIHGITKIEEILPEEDVDHFLDAFYFGAARVCRIIDKTPTTQEFGNHVIDAEICLLIGKSDDRLIISNDGTGKKEGLINTFESLGVYGSKAMTTQDYFKAVDFEINN